MITRVIALLGVLLLAGFCVAWWPGALLLGGVLLLTVARTRRVNLAKGGEGRVRT